MGSDKFHNRDFGFGDNGDMRCNPTSFESIGQNVEDGGFVAVGHGVGKNDKVNVPKSLLSQ